MKRNKYDFNESKARQLLRKINDSPWRTKLTYSKPVWTGDYKIKWVLNEKHSTHPDASVARSLIYLIPSRVVGRDRNNKTYIHYIIQSSPDFYITQEQYDELDDQQKKFFTNKIAPFSEDVITDRKGNNLYKMKYWEFTYFYSPTVVRNKVKTEFVRTEEPEIRKYREKLYRTGFGRKYLFKEHRPKVSKKIYETKGRNKKEQKELNQLINDGIAEFYGA